MEFMWEGLIKAFQLVGAGDPDVLDAAARSVWISIVAVALAGVCGILIGSVLARKKFLGRNLIILLFRASMGMPTVLIGLLCYGMFSRRGPFAGFELLYTSSAIVVGEFLLALPILVSWTHSAIHGLDQRVSETAITLGAGRFKRWWTYLSEARLSIFLALLTAFARCFTELGIAIMVGGNIRYRTRTLATSTVLETARGDFARACAMSLLLLAFAVVLTVVIAWLGREEKRT